MPFPLVPFVQVTASGTVMAAALWPFRHSLGVAPLAAQVCAGAAVYGAALILVNFQGVRATIAERLRVRDPSIVRRLSEVVSPVNEAA